MDKAFSNFLKQSIDSLKKSGLYKSERVICSAQAATIQTVFGQTVINLSANNYLGFSNHPRLIKAAKVALSTFGYGMSSVRFICGTQTIHKALEQKISQFLKTEDTILYSSCFDANTGLFETLLGEEDAVISDSLNHASIIDGIRLCKAQRFRYANNDMQDLEQKLKESQVTRFRLIATDGVFSMDGTFANLPKICQLAKRYKAITMVDDSHAVGFIGEKGRGTPEYWKLIGKIDILTGTLGKALGGASGGYISGRKEIIDWLRQRSRPYLFSNTLAPVIAATSIKAIELLEKNPSLPKKLMKNSSYFRKKLIDLGFLVSSFDHPIIPILIGEAKLATLMADQLLKEGVYVVSFSYPVVPKEKARLRVQLSAAHTQKDLDIALKAFEKVGRSLRVIR